ncbi:MAG: hypothetical protein QHH15_06850 [Candidatus Thermoplasmatota archaeon]|nr:hypothetical protein [Candidatus Thermoplasmatota archaeon]
MQKVSLIGIIVVVLLVLCSLTNVVGYQMVQSSNPKTIKDNIDQKELLFQTIIDIANNKEIQNVIQKSESSESLIKLLHVPAIILFLIKSRICFGLLLPQPSILNKSYLEYAYRMGVKLSKTISVSNMHSILEHFKVNRQVKQKEIINIIEKNDVFNKEIEQLSDLPCECEKDKTTGWGFPIICTLLFPLFLFSFMLYFKFNIDYPLIIIGTIGWILNCFWAIMPP